jgi:hypothetical protein
MTLTGFDHPGTSCSSFVVLGLVGLYIAMQAGQA